MVSKTLPFRCRVRDLKKQLVEDTVMDMVTAMVTDMDMDTATAMLIEEVMHYFVMYLGKSISYGNVQSI